MYDCEKFKAEFNETIPVIANYGSLCLSYVPKDLICRDREYSDLVSKLKIIVDSNGEYCCNHAIIGEGGIGKTLLAKSVVKEVERYAEEKGFGLFVEYFDCALFDSNAKIMCALYEQYLHESGRGAAFAIAIKKFVRKIKSDRSNFLLILDEVQNLKEEHLRSFLKLQDTLGQHNYKISLLLVSRDAEWESLKGEGLSRVTSVIRLRKYDKEQLKKIVRYRESLLYGKEVLSDSNVEYIASIIKKSAGLTRDGVKILNEIAQYMGKNKVYRIYNDEIRKLFPNILYSKFQSTFDKITLAQKVALYSVLRSIDQNKSRVTGIDDSYDEYVVFCKSIGTKPHVKMSFRKYVRILSDLDVLYCSKSASTEASEYHKINIQYKSNDVKSFARNLKERILLEKQEV